MIATIDELAEMYRTKPVTLARAHWYYVIRLLAFVLIIVAIVDKNRASPR